MGKVIVSDIFGRTPALEDLAQAVGSVMEIIDPYGEKQMGFHTEPSAYAHFMAHVGIRRYENILASRLADIPRVSVLIGFSVGALFSRLKSPDQCHHATGDYSPFPG